MKTVFKKINRGILLSAAIILAIVCYYIALEIKTGPDKKYIAAQMSELSNVLYESITVPEQYVFDGVKKSDLEAFINERREKLKPYFSNDAALDKVMESVTLAVYDQTVTPYIDLLSHTCDFQNIVGVKINYSKNTAQGTTNIGHRASYEYYDITVANDGSVQKIFRYYTENNYEKQLNVNTRFEKVDNKWLISDMDYHHWY